MATLEEVEQEFSEELNAESQAWLEGMQRLLAKKYRHDNHSYQQRPLRPAEKRVNFAAIKKILDEDAVVFDLRLREIIKQTRDSLLRLINEQGNSLSAEFVRSLRIDTGPQFATETEQYLMGVWRKNRDLAVDELPYTVRESVGVSMIRRYHESVGSYFKAAGTSLHGYQSAFDPDKIANYFLNRSNYVKGIVDMELWKQTSTQLWEHLKGGRTLIETMGILRNLFEPWVGDPTKLVPSGVTGTAEDILQAYRLETIVRVETLTALSQARSAVAEAAGEYVIGMEHSSILDFRTTDLCALADGIKIKKDDPLLVKLTPPLHWNCRSLHVYVTADDVPVEWTSQAKLDSLVRQVPAGFK